MSTRTAEDQINAARVLVTMAAAFRHLPAPAPRLERLPKSTDSTVFTWGVTLAVHDHLGYFELWREALGLDPAAVRASLEEDYTNWLEVSGVWSGVPVQVIGYFRFQDPEHAR
ncbi:hypothetical protein [Streptomyces sp. NRRL B-24484]|uniref:hypothetical protein n=1 Tax=Streptomyces sp. NRRL B-24484 TaxID=1463833 RepID=UPI000693DDBA|nr:hypothetical protein [Streptomyces sp. NRRL B-24484]